ncbi:hypothetical protein SDC9_205800 [bioreactor metagenome]|uniref:Uncharacterized protein n=1 Tax=bioreactor metagenome TaxID=1076179 RepID=A0A645J5X1_9ZZZZ
MNIKLENLIPFDMLIENPTKVFDLVESGEQVILLRDNKPSYILTKIIVDAENEGGQQTSQKILTLHEAMEIVLKDQDGRRMHAAALADEIYNRGLYLKKDGTKAEYTQIRARCNHYQQFEVKPGNIICLK